MSSQPDWRSAFEQELAAAETARLAGNQGKARVCARRAAGIVVREVIARRKLIFPRPHPAASVSAYDYLRYLAACPGFSPQTYVVLNHFILRVTPEHTLPGDPDLVAEVRWLAGELLP